MKFFVSLLATLLISSACFGEQATIFNDRDSIEREVATLLTKGDFNKLNQLEKSLRGSEKRSASGFPLLPFFYYGITNHISPKLDDPEQTKAIEKKVSDWVKRYPKEAAGHIAASELLVLRGWQIRGGGYANTVTPEKWKGFFDHLNQAKSHLIKNAAVASVSPQWYVQMGSIYQQVSAPRSEKDQIFSIGLKQFPLYIPLYMSAFTSHLPKWGGSVEEAENFIVTSTRSLAPEDADLMYASVYLASSQNQDITVRKSRADCKRLIRAAATHSENYPTQYNKGNATYAIEVCSEGS